jgi:uncharacterized protein
VLARSLLLLFLVFPVSAEIQFPGLTGRVVDQAGMVNANAKAMIERLSYDHERATGNQIIVVTLPDLQGQAIEEYGYQLGRHWQIGQKDANNGVLLIIAKAERQVRIEVGYGLEGQLTDAIASNIIYQVIRPAFKKAQFSQGIQVGVQSIIEALGGTYVAKNNVRESRDRKPYGWASLLVMGMLYFFLPLLGNLMGLGRPRSGRRSRYGRTTGYIGGGFGGGGRGGFGGGGFSGGGGGSFGGGGASGGW